MNRAARCVAVVALFAAEALLVFHASARVEAAPPCSVDGVDRVVAIGDVHGAYDRFVEILRTAGVIDARQRWTGGRMHLVQLGDLVDRGPDSRKALDLVRRLEREAVGAGGGVHALLGNHEVARMLGDVRYVDPGEYRAFATPDSDELRRRVLELAKPADRDGWLAETPLGSVEMRVAFGRDGEYGKWLRALDAVVRIDGVVFAHGGISPRVASMSCEEINETVRRELTTEIDKTRSAPLDSLAAREDGPLWYRGLSEQPDAFSAEVDQILARQKARAIVVAHTVSPTGRIRLRFGGRVVQIDTGMQPAYVKNGRASALEIRGGRFTAIYQDRRDVLAETAAVSVR
jgi:hypothetical protein